MLKKMKKYIAVLLTVTLICSFGLTGCGTNSASNSKEATAENPMYGINAGTWFVRKPYSTYSYAAVRRRG